MKETKMISIIMSEYNTEPEKLKKSIESILNQTYKYFEFIIVDDSGKNKLENIIKIYDDKRIKIIKNSKNMGLIYSLNRALKEAKGEYVIRMDTDDWSYPDRIEKELDFIIKNPQYSVVGMRYKYYNGKEEYGVSKFNGEVGRKEILTTVPFCHPTVIMKKEDIIKVGGYPNYNRCEDYALWIKLYLNGYKGYVMNDVGLKYTLTLDDYKKRTLKTRKGFFKLLKNEYIKLNPSKFLLMKMYIKTFIAGIVPHKLMYLYQKNKMEKIQ